MKKQISAFLVIVFFVLIALSGSTSKAFAAGDDSNALQGKIIGFINAGPDDAYAVYKNMLEECIRRAGGRLQYTVSDYNEQRELNNASDLVNAGVDAIVVIPVNAQSGGQVCKLANEAGIPVFPMVMIPDVETAGATWTSFARNDQYASAYKVGEYVTEHFPGLNTVIIDGNLQQSAAVLFHRGFAEALVAAGEPEPKSVGEGRWSKDGALRVAQDLIASGIEFDAIFVANEEMTGGVVQALQEAGVSGKKIYSVNGKEAGMEMIMRDELTVTIGNPPTLLSDLVAQIIIAHFKGEPVPHEVTYVTDNILVKATAHTAVPWEIERYFAMRDAGEIEYDLDFYVAEMQRRAASGQ